MQPTTSSNGASMTEVEHKAMLEKQEKFREIRNKDWDQSTVEEKLEKLKMVLTDLSANISYIHRELAQSNAKMNDFQSHSHDAHGEILIPMNKRNQNLPSGASLGAVAMKNPLD
jgi:hypothetical protein